MHIQDQDTLCFVFGASIGNTFQDQEFFHFPDPTYKLRERNSVRKLNTVSCDANNPSSEYDTFFFQKFAKFR